MSQQKDTKINHKIRAPKVLVINENGENIGEVGIIDAIKRASDLGLDLVEISSGNRTPVCKIMDYGKWKYEQAKKIKKNKSGTQKQVLKEIKFRPNTCDNDLEYRAKNAEKFLAAGHRVKLSVRFKGREMEHMYETGKSLLERFLALVKYDHIIDGNAIREGNAISLVLSTSKNNDNKNNN